MKTQCPLRPSSSSLLSWPLQQVKSFPLSLSLDFSSSRGPDRGQSEGPACGFVLVITPARHPGRDHIRFGEDNADNARIMSGIAGGKVQIPFRPCFFHVIPADKITGLVKKERSYVHHQIQSRTIVQRTHNFLSNNRNLVDRDRVAVEDRLIVRCNQISTVR